MSGAQSPPDASSGVSGGSALVSALEAAYDVLRTAHPELPAVVVVTGSGRQSRGLLWGHHCADRWAHVDVHHPELFISGECIAQGGAFVWLTLSHEAAHALGSVRGIVNCSGQANRYHNAKFKALAEELGCWYPRSEPHPSRGYTDVELTDVTLQRYAGPIAALDAALSLSIAPPEAIVAGGVVVGGDGGTVAGGPKRTDRNNAKFICGCEPARIMRMSVRTWELGAPMCTLCGEEFA